jgi:hypothetical protein
MLLATTQVEDVDRFVEVFSTRAAEKRKKHGSNGAVVFRDPFESDRVWGIFDGTSRAGRVSCPNRTFARSWRPPG